MKNARDNILRQGTEFGQRGAIAHGRFCGIFSDIDAQKIHFLEILTYAQLLKRVGLRDASNVQLRCRYDSIMEGNGRFVVECVHKRNDIDLKDEEG